MGIDCERFANQANRVNVGFFKLIGYGEFVLVAEWVHDKSLN